LGTNSLACIAYTRESTVADRQEAELRVANIRKLLKGQDGSSIAYFLRGLRVRCRRRTARAQGASLYWLRLVTAAPLRFRLQAVISAVAPGSAPRHPHLFPEVRHITKNRGNRHHLAIAAITYQAIARRDAALNFDVVPFLSVADVVDGHVVMLAPEERDIGKSLS
jgi:hypothetical protein